MTPLKTKLIILTLLLQQISSFNPSVSIFTARLKRTTSLFNEPPPPSTVAPDINTLELDIPKTLPSDVGFDYVPLATMLSTGQLAEADQFTRDALISLAGSKEKGRNFVYFTEVKNIPSTDLATMERLWQKFSGGEPSKRASFEEDENTRAMNPAKWLQTLWQHPLLN